MKANSYHRRALEGSAALSCTWSTHNLHQSLTACVFRDLQEVIKSRFDAEQLDSVLRSKEHTPSWVGGLTSDKIGRQLIYDLSGFHKNSLMLNFAVQKILADGHDQEVRTVSPLMQAAMQSSTICHF